MSSRTHSFALELVEPGDRCLGRVDPGPRLLASVESVILETEQTNDEGQGQPLPDERDEDDREGEEENQVATWKGRAGIGLERQGERCCERQRAPHARPREKDGALPARHPSRDPFRSLKHRKDPGETQNDHRQAHERRVAEKPRAGDVAECVDDDG